jgi:hypothetical protein
MADVILSHNGSSATEGTSQEEPATILLHISASTDTSEQTLQPEVSKLLDDFALVFSKLTSLPPVRSCDHVIPLVPGARPVNIRPYKYPPLKDGIEN